MERVFTNEAEQTEMKVEIVFFLWFDARPARVRKSKWSKNDNRVSTEAWRKNVHVDTNDQTERC